MMGKMRLAAIVPNEGARRLAAWLLTQPVGTYDRLARHVGGVIQLDRMAAGEVTPGSEVGGTIYSFTRGAVLVGDWYRRPAGGWFDPVPARPAASPRKLAA